ncbi:hypothetical protein evm_011631 [Chilo suppressalis]|nr:hypothetical protein evm_011631 [Chilo suppressalis]
MEVWKQLSTEIKHHPHRPPPNSKRLHSSLVQIQSDYEITASNLNICYYETDIRPVIHVWGSNLHLTEDHRLTV